MSGHELTLTCSTIPVLRNFTVVKSNFAASPARAVLSSFFLPVGNKTGYMPLN